jgi:hypothetical protein
MEFALQWMEPSILQLPVINREIKIMRQLIMRGAVMLGVGLSGTSAASTISWNTETGSSSTSFSCGSGFGNTCTFNSGGEILKARAYSTVDDIGVGKFEQAMLNVYSDGISVMNPRNTNESNPLQPNNPNRSVDNDGRDDFVVFEYDDANYNPTGFMIGWKNTDADIRAWIGGESLGANYDFTDQSVADLTGLGFTSFRFDNVSVDTLNLFNTELTGRYLILAPQIFNIRNLSDNQYDYFKISGITGSGADPIPPAEIPEPGTAALLGIALVGLWANRRQMSPARVRLPRFS